MIRRSTGGPVRCVQRRGHSTPPCPVQRRQNAGEPAGPLLQPCRHRPPHREHVRSRALLVDQLLVGQRGRVRDRRVRRFAPSGPASNDGASEPAARFDDTDRVPVRDTIHLTFRSAPDRDGTSPARRAHRQDRPLRSRRVLLAGEPADPRAADPSVADLERAQLADLLAAQAFQRRLRRARQALPPGDHRGRPGGQDRSRGPLRHASGRPLVEDHGRSQRRDPRAEEHHQHDGGPVERLCLGSDARRA